MARIYPKLPLIKDPAARESLRLLWDCAQDALERVAVTEATLNARLASDTQIKSINTSIAQLQKQVAKTVRAITTTGTGLNPGDPGTTPPFTPPTSEEPPNRFSVVQEVDNDDPSLKNDPHSFTAAVAARLELEDPLWGRRINSTGPLSDDVVAFKQSDGDPPYSIDILANAHTPSVAASWQKQGRIGGEWTPA